MHKITFPNFEQASVLIVGDVMLDRYWFGDANRVSPEAPVPIVKVNQLNERPGGAGNVALNVAALGAKSHLLGVTGNDEAAKILEQQFKKVGINYNLVRNEQKTITKLRVISRHQQLIRLDFEEKLTDINFEIMLQCFQNNLSHANVVILSDYSKGTIPNPQPYIELAKKSNIPVLVDPKGLDFKIYRGSTLITPNLKEFEAIVGVCNTEEQIRERAQNLLLDCNIEAMLLTRGERGMTLFQKNKREVYLPARAREVFDVTGAGDTVIAVLAAAIGAQSNLETAMHLASAAAGLVVGKLGAGVVTKAELDIAMANANKIASGVVSEPELLTAVNVARLQGKKIIFTNGCFDVLHAGHVDYLQKAKQIGDFLIVAINDDESIRRLKGPARPINCVEQRMAVLAALSAVDWVTSYNDDTPRRLLELLKPDVLVKGGDYSLDEVVGADIVYSYGGDVRVLGIKINSSSKIIQQMETIE